MNDLFEKYKTLYGKYIKTFKAGKDEIPGSLFLFNARFRHTLGLVIDFDDAIALVKTRDLKECNILRLKLAELWNVFEALLVFLREIKIVKDKEKNLELCENKTLMDMAEDTFEKAWYRLVLFCKNDKRLKGFSEYMKKILQDNEIRKARKTGAENLFQYLEHKKERNNADLLNLVYIERNIFFHSGEAVKMRMTYPQRKKLLTIYCDFLESLIFALINGVLERSVCDAR